MAMTTCPDCKSEVSTEAATCPKCGRPTTEARKTEANQRRNAQVFLLVVLGFGAWGFWTFYRSFTGADLVGTPCTLRVGSRLGGSGVPLFPSPDEANRAYGAGLLGKVTERDFERATWVPAETTATIEQKSGTAFYVSTYSQKGWVSTDFCKR